MGIVVHMVRCVQPWEAGTSVIENAGDVYDVGLNSIRFGAGCSREPSILKVLFCLLEDTAVMRIFRSRTSCCPSLCSLVPSQSSNRAGRFCVIFAAMSASWACKRDEAWIVRLVAEDFVDSCDLSWTNWWGEGGVEVSESGESLTAAGIISRP